MKLQHFKALLQANCDKQLLLLLQLPDGQAMPRAFHITEVGAVNKTFIDCGGKVHNVQTCQMQAWIGPDVDHRIEAGKMADILQKSEAILPHDFLDLEIEYEDEVISQYPVAEAIVSDEAIRPRAKSAIRSQLTSSGNFVRTTARKKSVGRARVI